MTTTDVIVEPPQVDLSSSTAERVRRAARADTALSVLEQLAHDPDILVRTALVLNPAKNRAIDDVLARDADDRVRAFLAGHNARLVTQFDGDSEAGQHLRATLTAMARDQSARVRSCLTAALAPQTAAPRDLVLLLARDPAARVSDPLLRLSPILTDTDLLALLSEPPSSASATAIAGRTPVNAPVAQAIADGADTQAIRTLLVNHAARIGEAVLERLIDRAAAHPDWHGPLVRRPRLTVSAVRSLSQLVAADHLRVLATRTDLLGEAAHTPRSDSPAARDDDAIFAHARKLLASNSLSEQTMLNVASSGIPRHLAIYLAVSSGTSLAAIERTVELRSAKAIVSLVWKAGFSMRVGTLMQSGLAQLPPESMIRPAADGTFPLTPEEMEWQLELVGSSAPLAT